VGFTASKKVGNAVERNLSKRKLRAGFLELQEKLEDGIFVFVAKREILEVEYKALIKSLVFALKRVGALKRS
jgi:ribonuclease P protein component